MTAPLQSDAQQQPSGALAIVAAILPIVGFVSLPLALVVIANGLGGALANVFREMGGAAAMLVAGGTIVGVVASAALVLLSARGARIPGAVAILFASLPYLAGLVGEATGVHMVERAIGGADASSRATLIAQGLSEAGLSRLAGSFTSGGLLAFTGLGLAVAAAARRAPSRRAAGLLLGLLALPSVGIVLVAWSTGSRGMAGVSLVLPALLGVVAASIAGLAAGQDEPHGRSGALAASAGAACALAVILVVSALATLDLLHGLRAFAMVVSSERGELAAHLADEVGALQSTSRLAIVLAALPVVGLAVYAGLRAPPSGGRIAGAAAVVALSVLLVLPASRTVGVALDAETQPWSGASSFVATISHQSAEVDDPIVVEPRRIVLKRGGEAISITSLPIDPRARTELATKLRTRLLGRDDPEPPPDPPGTPRLQRTDPFDEAGDLGMPTFGLGRSPTARELRLDRFRPQPRLAFAFDARVRGDLVRAILDSAAQAGARSVVFIGLGPGAGATPETRARLSSISPLLRSLVETPRGHLVFLEGALRDGVADGDTTLYHGTIDGSYARISTRAGATQSAFTIGPGDIDPPAATGNIVLLAMQPTTTAADVARITDGLILRSKLPVLVTGAFPGHPESPAAPTDLVPSGGIGDPPSRLRDLFGTAPDLDRAHGPTGIENAGTPTVRGSLAPDVIRRVIRRGQPSIRACYEGLLTRRANAEGRVSVRFVIAPSGSVQTATATESTLDDPPTDRCIEAAVRRLSFPAPDGGGSVLVTYPFGFRPAE